MTAAPIWCRTRDELAEAVAEQIPTRHRAAVIASDRWRQGIDEAWAAEWRDADWLAKCAVTGCDHEGTTDPVGLILFQLLAASDEPCPEWRPVPEVIRATLTTTSEPERTSA